MSSPADVAPKLDDPIKSTGSEQREAAENDANVEAHSESRLDVPTPVLAMTTNVAVNAAIADSTAAADTTGNGPTITYKYTCDVCKVAVFPTMQEAVIHEKYCSSNTAPSGKPISGADDVAVTKKGDIVAVTKSKKKQVVAQKQSSKKKQGVEPKKSSKRKRGAEQKKSSDPIKSTGSNQKEGADNGQTDMADLQLCVEIRKPQIKKRNKQDIIKCCIIDDCPNKGSTTCEEHRLVEVCGVDGCYGKAYKSCEWKVSWVMRIISSMHIVMVEIWWWLGVLISHATSLYFCFQWACV